MPVPFSQYFPVWDRLAPHEREMLTSSSVSRKVPAGTLICSGGDNIGVIIVRSGRLRAYISSDEGKELTVYRLFEKDLSILSVADPSDSIGFDIHITAEKNSEIWIIPTAVYKQLMENSAPLANLTSELLASALSSIIYASGRVLWKGIHSRLARFLLDESALEGTTRLKLTHETIASHLGTAREVVTRTLKDFQDEGLVSLSRGYVVISDAKGLENKDI